MLWRRKRMEMRNPADRLLSIERKEGRSADCPTTRSPQPKPTVGSYNRWAIAFTIEPLWDVRRSFQTKSSSSQTASLIFALSCVSGSRQFDADFLENRQSTR